MAERFDLGNKLVGYAVESGFNIRVIVQDEATSVVWGMPGFVARAGLAEKILPLDQIGSEILRRVAGQAMQVHAT